MMMNSRLKLRVSIRHGEKIASEQASAVIPWLFWCDGLEEAVRKVVTSQDGGRSAN